MNDDFRLTPAAIAAAAKGDFANALFAATPGGIEAQEAAGQRAMASSFRTLPKDMDRATGEKVGFVFGEDDDDLFVCVTAPEGWVIRPTDHSMHSDIVDEQGRRRGSIFYKAAFYDRRAHGNWLTRYQVVPEYTSSYDTVGFKAVDSATGDTLFSVPVPEQDENAKWKARSQVETLVRAKLAERFPDCLDPAAYWSE